MDHSVKEVYHDKHDRDFSPIEDTLLTILLAFLLVLSSLALGASLWSLYSSVSMEEEDAGIVDWPMESVDYAQMYAVPGW